MFSLKDLWERIRFWFEYNPSLAKRAWAEVIRQEMDAHPCTKGEHWRERANGKG